MVKKKKKERSQSARHFRTNFEFPSFKVWKVCLTATECRLWIFPLKLIEENCKDWKPELSYRAFTIQDSWSVCLERDYTFVFPFLSRRVFVVFPGLITPQGSTSGLAFSGIDHLSLACVLSGRLSQFKTLGPRAQTSDYQIVYFPLCVFFLHSNFKKEKQTISKEFDISLLLFSFDKRL